MRFVSDEEWARATAVPVTTAREISEAERQEAVQLSTAIARITRSVTAQMEHLADRPAKFTDLLAFATDPQAAVNAWLEPLRGTLGAVSTARRNVRRLVELLGEDATLPDHAWGSGREPISLATISDAVSGAEAQVAPLVALDKATKVQSRRSVA